MKLTDLKKLINELPSEYDDWNVVIEKVGYSPGPRPTIDVDEIAPGFDWDSGKIIITPIRTGQDKLDYMIHKLVEWVPDDLNDLECSQKSLGDTYFRGTDKYSIAITKSAKNVAPDGSYMALTVRKNYETFFFRLSIDSAFEFMDACGSFEDAIAKAQAELAINAALEENEDR